MSRVTVILVVAWIGFAVGAAGAGQSYVVSSQTGGQLWRIQDVNGDADALDLGERTIWGEGLVSALEIEATGRSIYAVEAGLGAGLNCVVRFEDVNRDGDALDLGERRVWADGFTSPWGIASDGLQNWYVSDSLSLNMFKLTDVNGDGDALDLGERVVFADGLGTATGLIFNNGALYAADYSDGIVRRLSDLNGDGDALDIGENLIVTPNHGQLVGMLADGVGGFYFSSYFASTVRHAVDYNGDGDFLDLAETLSYADNVFGGIANPTGMMHHDAGGFLLADFTAGTIRSVYDVTRDADGLDQGEVRVFADGIAAAFDIAVLPAGLPGDYNNDGFVDAADYVMWRKVLATPSFNLLNEDATEGTVTAGDYGVWARNFGESLNGSGGAGMTPLPEGGGVVAACLGMLTLGGGRRRYWVSVRGC